MPSMLDVLSVNTAKRNPAVRFYEMATVYHKKSDDPLADESVWLTLGEYGDDAGFFQLKGCIESILKNVRVNNIRFAAQKDNASFHPGRCADIYSGDICIGTLGQIHPLVCDGYELDHAAFYAQLNVPVMLSLQGPEVPFRPLPKYPAVSRDLSLVCKAEIPAADLETAICASGGEYLESVKLFDVYKGLPIPEGMKSISFSLSLRAEDQTLTEAHVNETMQSILNDLEKKFGAVIR